MPSRPNSGDEAVLVRRREQRVGGLSRPIVVARSPPAGDEQNEPAPCVG